MRVPIYKGYNSDNDMVFWETEVPICCGGFSIARDHDGLWKALTGTYQQPSAVLSHEDLARLLLLIHDLWGVELVTDNDTVWSSSATTRFVCPHIGNGKRQSLVKTRRDWRLR